MEQIEGRWPWETGSMPNAPESKSACGTALRSVPYYTLPLVPDRRADGGRRLATVRDLVRLKHARGKDGTPEFLW